MESVLRPLGEMPPGDPEEINSACDAAKRGNEAGQRGTLLDSVTHYVLGGQHALDQSRST